jgi:hypothetical protein
MRSTQYQPAPGRAVQILRESTIVCRAIARRQREVALRGRTEEAREMEALSCGVYSMVLAFTRPAQLPNAA